MQISDSDRDSDTFRVWQARKRLLTRALTLHRRLTLWTAGLLLVMGLGLVVLINSLTAARLPQAVSIDSGGWAVCSRAASAVVQRLSATLK